MKGSADVFGTVYLEDYELTDGTGEMIFNGVVFSIICGRRAYPSKLVLVGYKKQMSTKMVVDDQVGDKMGIISAVTMSRSCGGCIGSEVVLGAVSNFGWPVGCLLRIVGFVSRW